jgi:transposase
VGTRAGPEPVESIVRAVVWGRRNAGTTSRAASADAELAELRARLAALETENAELLVEQTKLATERDILRQAAKYFAGETHW